MVNKWLIGAVFFLAQGIASFAIGYRMGGATGKAEVKEIRADIKQEAVKQEAKVAEQVTKQEDVNHEVTTQVRRALSGTGFFNGLRVKPTNPDSGDMPATTEGAKDSDAATTVHLSESGCERNAIIASGFQEWAKQQGLAVDEHE